MKRAPSLTEQPSGAQLSRAPSQAGPNAEPGTGKGDLNSSDQNWWMKIGSHRLPTLNISKTALWLNKWSCVYVDSDL